MKKYLIFSILSLIFTIGSLPAETVKKLEINANPINVALVVAEKGDSTKMVDTFHYYGYTQAATEGDYKIMRDDNGNEISYSFTAPDASLQYPKVMVTTAEHPKDFLSRLDDLKFKKSGTHYRRIVNYDRNHYTNCHLDSPQTLTFQRTPPLKRECAQCR